MLTPLQLARGVLLSLLCVSSARLLDAQQTVMDAAEFAAYNSATQQSTPQAQAPALEAYLAAYPNSPVKAYVLNLIMIDYSGLNLPKAVQAADALLRLQPANLQAYIIEAVGRKQAAEAQTDPDAKQSALDIGADYGRRGLAVVKGPVPSGMTPDQFASLKAYSVPVFYSVIGEAALGRKDGPAAIAAYQAELAAMKPADLATPGALQEDYYLAASYINSDPPDFLNCAFYATRAASLAPEQFKSQLQPLATYCYKKYHGGVDGYETLVASAKANVHPPAGFYIARAPSPADMVADLVRSTSDLAMLALSDKEFALQYGRPEDAERVWTSIKGKSVQVPGVLVIDSSPTAIRVALSEDAVEAKKADYVFRLRQPIDPASVPPGSKVTLTGVYESFSSQPLLITMVDANIGSGRPSLPVPRPTGGNTQAKVEEPPPPPAVVPAPSRGMGRPAQQSGSHVDIPHNYALIFATNQYDHWPQLQNPIPDADTLGDTLKSLYGFQIDEVKNPTNTQILAKLTEYLHRKFEPQDQLLIFFSGHGYFDSDLGQGFIVPANAQMPANDSSHLTLVAHDQIMRYVNGIPSQHVVLIIDACFSGTLDRKIADGGMRGAPTDVYVHATLPELLQRKESKRTRRYFASGGKDFVPDGVPGHHSPFMAALLVTLNNAADRKGYATLADLQEGLETVKPEPRWGDIENDSEPAADFLLLTQDAISKLKSP